ncbi:S-layer homology domain-containing protein [Gorillibacterium sp. CAU 1737]|uniref:S-layer homology domain-containing protein n=1 Tax=Gorillibacterium sp. CAU 1737 TaxID=3140362 RepID=UPI00326173DC
MDAWMRKKTMAGLLALALAVSPFAGAVSQASAATAAAASFTDVEKSYAKTEIEELVKLGILSGDGAGQFNPTAGSTRAEMAKVLTLALGLKPNPEAAAPFKDIPANAWYKGYVGAMVASGITKGTSATSFSPNEQVSREALAVFYIRAMGLEQSAQALQGEAAFADAGKISSWALPAVRLAAKLGFIQGVEKDGKLYFEPAAKAERQALAKLTYSFYVNKEEYVEQAAKIVKEEGNPSAWPSVAPTPSATPTPTPVSGGGGGGYIPPVATPTPTSGSTPTPTPTDSTNPTPAPTQGSGDATVNAPYFVDQYKAGSTYIRGLADGHATIRVYYNKELLGSGESEYNGIFAVSLNLENTVVTPSSTLEVTAQRDGGNESKSLLVPVLSGSDNEKEKTPIPVVFDVHGGDFLLTGKSMPYTSISIEDEQGNFLGYGNGDPDGSFRAIVYSDVEEGDVLQVTARASGWVGSDPVKIIVKSPLTEKGPDEFLKDSVYEGPAYLNLKELKGMSYRIKTSTFSTWENEGGIFFQPFVNLKAGETIEIAAQQPGKAPVVKQVTVLAASGKIEAPSTSSMIRFDSPIIQVDTIQDAALYMTTEDGNSYFGYSPKGGEHRTVELNTYRTLKPGSKVYLYAYIPGKQLSDPFLIQVAPLPANRVAQPSVAQAVYEGDSTLTAQVEEGSVLLIYHLGSAPKTYTHGSFYNSVGGVVKANLSDVLQEGDKLILVTQKNGHESSVPLVIEVQAHAESSAIPTVTGTVYEGDFYLPIQALNTSLEVYDANGLLLGTFKTGKYSIGMPLSVPIPAGSPWIKVIATEEGKHAVEFEIPVKKNSGQTSPITFVGSAKIYPGISDFTIATQPGDIILITWGQYKMVWLLAYDKLERNIQIGDDPYYDFKTGDVIHITVKSPGKAAATLDVTVSNHQ